MLRLQKFGGFALLDHTGAAAALKRRRLALLALLAVAGDRGVTREKLAAYLWPESPEAQSRHALEQLLCFVRQQLPSDPCAPFLDGFYLGDSPAFERWSEAERSRLAVGC